MPTAPHATALATLQQSHRSADHSSRDIREMVKTLEARHGAHAADMADFFETANDLDGNAGRAAAWADIASRIRLRERLRQLATTPDAG